MKPIVAADIGGTHARFAIAALQGKAVAHLAEAVTLRTGEHASFETVWEEFQRRSGGALPRVRSGRRLRPTARLSRRWFSLLARLVLSPQ